MFIYFFFVSNFFPITFFRSFIDSSIISDSFLCSFFVKIAQTYSTKSPLKIGTKEHLNFIEIIQISHAQL